MIFKILGSGGSFGVPVVGCTCDVCSSNDPKDKRLRSSALLEISGKQILIDASPDLRYCLIQEKITSLDGLFITHFHNDHIAGLDELRPFFNLKFPLVVSKYTYEYVAMRFPYLIERMDASFIKGDVGEGDFLGIPFRYCTYKHHNILVNGFSFGKVAYITDIKEYDDRIFDCINGADILILSCSCLHGTHKHLSLNEAIEIFKRSNARKCYLTHISHRVLHGEFSKRLPSDIFLAYDGLTLDV